MENNILYVISIGSRDSKVTVIKKKYTKITKKNVLIDNKRISLERLDDESQPYIRYTLDLDKIDYHVEKMIEIEKARLQKKFDRAKAELDSIDTKWEFDENTYFSFGR